MKNLYYFLVAGFVSLAISGYSQTETQINSLRTLSEREAKNYLITKAQAVEWAKLNGYPVTAQVGETFVEIQYIDENGRPQYFKTDNGNSAATISTRKVFPGGGAGLSLTGLGITVREWDGASALATHQEFGARVTVVDGSSSGAHSTHVAGTIMGAGVNAGAKGMAYQASLRSFDWNSDVSEMAGEGAAGALISNNSYGFVRGWYNTGTAWVWFGTPAISTQEDYLFGFYDGSAQLWDQIAKDAPYFLICKSAGNDRGEVYSGYPADGPFDCIEQKGIAKNVLTVGAVDDIIGGYTAPSSVIMSSFSSWGPADDGRIKPDIVANGVSLYSSVNTNNTSYGYMTGTSMATPSVSGSLALLQQHYYNLTGSYMLSSTAKALVVHTADEAGPNTGPDYMFGWGLMNTQKAARQISENQMTNVITEHILNSWAAYSRNVVALGTEPFKVTIVWTDPPGTPPPASLDPFTPMLVNDLDLLITQAANTYYPWKLDRDNPALAATNTAENNVDNVEVVYIANPVAGATYSITVDHDGILSGDSQAFSMVISGIASAVPPTANFETGNTTPAVNTQVNFSDLSLYGPTSWNWSFSPATVTYLNSTSSSSRNPQVQFNAAGLYTVTLTAANANGSDAEIKTNYINVSGCLFDSFPVTEDFEVSNFPPTCWSATPVTGTSNWGRSTVASGSGSGSASAYADFYNHPNGRAYDLKSMPLTISGLTYPTVRFNYAYATYSGEVDRLDVYYSTDNGGSYALLLAMSGGTGGILNTGGTVTAPFVPAASQWRTRYLLLPAGTNMIKFRATSGFGNNLYLDDVMVFENVAHDVSTVSVDLAAVNMPGSYAPQATVINYGASTETFPVTMTIGAYTSTQTVTALAPGDARQVTFDPWTAPAGGHTVEVCTQLAVDENTPNDCLSKGVKILELNKQVYAYLTNSGTGMDPKGPTSFSLSTPGTLNSIVDQSALNFIAGATWAEGKWYGVVYNTVAPYNFVTINPSNGARTVIGTTSVNMSALSYNTVNNTMYAISWSSPNSYLYSINITTGANTLIGTCGAGLLINLAINNAGKAYAVNISSDVLVTVDLVTGTFTPVGSIGFNANNAQDMEFDRESGELYIAAYSTSGWLGWVNQSTGEVMKIGDFEGGGEVSGFAIPYASTGSDEKVLSAGWTWFSVNLSNADMSVATVLSNLNSTDGDYIKNQTVSSTYYAGSGWFGELSQIDPREMYKIKLAKADILKINGICVDPLTNPININTGWNWIGFIPQLAKPVADALPNLLPVGDDYIKNQTKSSTFYEGSGWFGELNDLEPMDGYMLKTSHPGTLIYAELTSGNFKDARDGKIYPWVKIGDQTWMAENLAYLPAVSPSSEGSSATPYYYVYGYEGSIVSTAKATANYGTYGALYNWPAALSSCPAGWHMPGDSEWTVLTDYLINSGFGYQGTGSDIGKSLASTSGWTVAATAGTVGNNQASNNTSGFSARPGGYRYNDNDFYDLAGYAYFWSSSASAETFAWIRRLYFESNVVDQSSYPRGSGFSVRCIKD